MVCCRVIVNDVNDRPPIFDQSSYSTNVPEVHTSPCVGHSLMIQLYFRTLLKVCR